MKNTKDLLASSYVSVGVDTEREETGLQRLVAHIQGTWPQERGLGHVELPAKFFANVIDLGIANTGLAITADGVGSKVLIAQMLEKYDTIGIDCIAMNVNDLICVGAKPLSLVDYIAIQNADPEMLEGIAIGLAEGARQAGISIPGGEIAQLHDIINGYRDGLGFDLAGMAVGTVPLDRIIIGENIEPGDIIVGIESNGIHSNGLTLARRALFEQGSYSVASVLPEFGHPLGEELLRPTHIYVPEIVEILEASIGVKALIHITSDGFLNLTRVKSPTGYVIEELPDPPPIFSLIQQAGDVDLAGMFEVFNMGIGFCVIAAPADVDRVRTIIEAHHKRTFCIGRAVHDPKQHVRILPRRLVGLGKRFAHE
jgi:phosphoribosylformylglycinamidine cyclo-ligase